ncbi:MAG: hypothetical protein GY943_13935 [Chloroflexi bacterium]|nr:hypothetical protein [Chloroflexota bacterium]
MKKWLRRFIYSLLTLLWLLVMTIPFLAFLLAARGEVHIGSNPQRNVRIFNVQEELAEGVGVEWTRPFTPSASTASCTKTNIAYLFWENDSGNQNSSYCQCIDLLTNASVPIAPNSCQ